MLCIQTHNIDRAVPEQKQEQHTTEFREFREFSWDDVHVEMPPNHHFAFGKRIGSGTTSTVYKAHHPFHGWTAVKAIHPIYAECVKAELDVLRRVQGYGHIIRVFDAWNVDDNWYIATELFEGTLLDRMKAGMSVDEINDAAKQIAAGLTFLHAKDIVHFDLKPENIGYVTHANGRVIYKIMDLGAAEFLTTVQSHAFQEGIRNQTIAKTSKWYRAYELFGFQNETPSYVTDKVDVWSLGCILYEMLSKQPLFKNVEYTDDLLANKSTIIDGWFDVAKYVSISPSKKHAELATLALECVGHSVSKRPNSFTVFTKL